MTTIPAGHHLIDRPLVIDNAFLTASPARSLYCTKGVEIDRSVDPDVLEDKIDHLVARATIICPAHLGELVHRKSRGGPQVEVLLYEGKLWTLDGVMGLSPSSFDYLEVDKATLVVRGVVDISPDLEPQVLADRLAKVHNYGVINCSAQQMGAIQARLGVGAGTLQRSDEGDDTDEPELEAVMGNVAYLAL